MKNFNEQNPIPVFLYFLFVFVIPVFIQNPFTAILSFSGAMVYCIIMRETGARSILFFMAALIIMSLVNPVFYHNGMTVMFVVNDKPITFEALFYGIVSSFSLVSLFIRSVSFSKNMTSDRIMYVSGSVFPKLALMISMTLRFVPMFLRHMKKTSDAQKAMGLYKDGNIVDRLRGSVRVFSITLTYALENGIITSDSMSARGYGSGRRSSYSYIGFSKSDIVLTVILSALAAAFIVPAASGAVAYTFYPRIIPPQNPVLSALAYASFGIMSFLPALWEMGVRLKWKYLRRKI